MFFYCHIFIVTLSAAVSHGAKSKRILKKTL
jgi:hypothetical protein